MAGTFYQEWLARMDGDTSSKWMMQPFVEAAEKAIAEANQRCETAERQCEKLRVDLQSQRDRADAERQARTAAEAKADSDRASRIAAEEALASERQGRVAAEGLLNIEKKARQEAEASAQKLREMHEAQERKHKEKKPDMKPSPYKATVSRDGNGRVSEITFTPQQ